jgi:hypothetical protein
VSEIRSVQKVKLLAAVTLSRGIDLSVLRASIEAVFGELEDQTDVYDFKYTTYYQDEMGPELCKLFISFKELIHPGSLPELKIRAIEFEKEWSINNKRQINLDPGYLNTAKVVIASAKDFAHRIFLADGIYGDLQLQYRHNRFWPQAWTFPDYQTELAFEFFTRVRERFADQEKQDER